MWPFLNNVITSCECIACTPATSICYTGVNLTCIGVNKNDSLSVALEKIDALMCVPITNSEIITALGYTPANDDNVVHKSGTETITGDKTFSGSIYFSEGILATGVVIEDYSAINYKSNGFLVQVDITPATDYRTILFPDASGTVALLENLTNYVPYTGATTNVNLGEFQLTTGQVSFDQTPTGAAGAGVLRWNDADGTLDLGLKGGNVTLQVGQEQIVRVVNKTGANLLESQYKVVRIRIAAEGGAQGQKLAVVLAQANNDADSITTLGVVTENINNNQEGFITTFGNVSNINTTGSLQGETWVDGDVLYLSPTTPGQLTKIKPIAPQHSVTVGYVVYAHAVNGKIFIKVDNGYELEELHNVLINTPVNNQILTYESATSLWKNKTVSDALGFTPVNPILNINTTSPLLGGGNLTTDRTLSIQQSTGIQNGYLSSTDWNTFNNKQPAGNYITSLTGEVIASGAGAAVATLSTPAVTGKILTGLNITGGSISATDSILSAFGKVQNQINGVLGGSIFQTTWNASTNTPILTSSIGTKGYYYIVDVAGSTNLDGIIDWKIGDWAIYDGTVWRKVDNTDAVSSVNGFTGAVSLTTSNITEETNLYYTEGRVSANTDVSANTAVRHNAVTLGTTNGLSLSGQQISLGLSSTSTIGALSSTDWNVFNNKQNALGYTPENQANKSDSYTASSSTTYASTKALVDGLATKQNTITNPITGTGTTNYVPKFTGSSTLGNSSITDNGSLVTITKPTTFIGLNTIQGTTESDGGQLGSELTTTATGTNWTGTGFATGYTHTTGDVTPLVSTLVAVTNNLYQITYTITGRTTGSITINYGGIAISGITSSGNTGPKTTSTATLNIVPTTDFNGTVVVSVKVISPSVATTTFKNSSGVVANEIRAHSNNTNLSIGLNAGQSITTGNNNINTGANAGQSITTGINNVNTGANAGQSITTGNNNINTGLNAGRYIADKSTAATILNNSVMLGYRTSPLADNQTNQVVIGYDATGLGSNTTVIGNSSTTTARVYGRQLVNTSTDNGTDQLQVNGSVLATTFKGGAALTGIPTAPTATAGTNTTQIANMAALQVANSENVKLTGNQIIAGTKTFTGIIDTGAGPADWNVSGGRFFMTKGSTDSYGSLSFSSQDGYNYDGFGTATLSVNPEDTYLERSLLDRSRYSRLQLNAGDAALFSYGTNSNVFLSTSGTGSYVKLNSNDVRLGTDSASIVTAPTAAPGTTGNQVATLDYVQANARPYKVYTALLSQTGTSAPTATVLENTLGGTVVWTRSGIGSYQATLTGSVYTSSKTVVFATIGLNKNLVINGARVSDSVVSIMAGTGDLDSTNMSIEIRVYN